MKPMVIHGTAKTPEAYLDNLQGVMKIKGRSVPENSYEYYSRLMNWVDEYKTCPKDVTTFDIGLEYFNSSSAHCLMDLIKSLESIHDHGKTITINWFYETDDDDMKSEIEVFESLVRIPFRTIEVPSLKNV
jgi:hypothetical protein